MVSDMVSVVSSGLLDRWPEEVAFAACLTWWPAAGRDIAVPRVVLSPAHTPGDDGNLTSQTATCIMTGWQIITKSTVRRMLAAQTAKIE